MGWMNAEARRSKGVMMIELTAAALVFAIAVTGYFGVQAVKERHILAAKELSLAQQGCANKLEELRAVSVEAVGQQDGKRFSIKGLSSNSGPAGRILTTEHENLWEVVVEARWSSHGREHSFQLWTFLPKDG